MRILAPSLLHCDQQPVHITQQATQWTGEQTAFTIKRDHSDPVHSQ